MIFGYMGLEHLYMNQKIRACLESHKKDFQQQMGYQFRHFFCPILQVDEDAELQKGHIVNKAFEQSSRAWVIQRRDVDGFFGSLFEAEFVKPQDMRTMTMADAFLDPNLNRQICPRVLRNGQRVPYITRQTNIPDVFTPVTIGDEEQSMTIGIKMTQEELLASTGDMWEFAVDKDVRVPAVVSLIKTAHLSLFYLLGYRYAAFPAGRFVGHDILGKFFKGNFRDQTQRQKVMVNAHAHFREFVHMVRPVAVNGLKFEGSILDGMMLVCIGTSGRLWALIVFVKTASLMHSVLMPTFSDAEAAATFHDFLKNDNETINVTTCRYNRSQRIWELNPHAKPLNWPKSGVLYPEPEAPAVAEAGG